MHAWKSFYSTFHIWRLLLLDIWVQNHLLTNLRYCSISFNVADQMIDMWLVSSFWKPVRALYLVVQIFIKICLIIGIFKIYCTCIQVSLNLRSYILFVSDILPSVISMIIFFVSMSLFFLIRRFNWMLTP